MIKYHIGYIFKPVEHHIFCGERPESGDTRSRDMPSIRNYNPATRGGRSSSSWTISDSERVLGRRHSILRGSRIQMPILSVINQSRYSSSQDGKHLETVTADSMKQGCRRGWHTPEIRHPVGGRASSLEKLSIITRFPSDFELALERRSPTLRRQSDRVCH